VRIGGIGIDATEVTIGPFRAFPHVCYERQLDAGDMARPPSIWGFAALTTLGVDADPPATLVSTVSFISLISIAAA